jgi:hypothetical protein
MLKPQYLVAPVEALEAGQPLVYAEPMNVPVGIKLTQSLKTAIAEEMLRDPQRYKVGRSGRGKNTSEAEVIRAALQVFFRLRATDPALFFDLRDSLG